MFAFESAEKWMNTVVFEKQWTFGWSSSLRSVVDYLLHNFEIASSCSRTQCVGDIETLFEESANDLCVSVGSGGAEVFFFGGGTETEEQLDNVLKPIATRRMH